MTGKLAVAALVDGALVYGTHGRVGWLWLALLAVVAVLVLRGRVKAARVSTGHAHGAGRALLRHEGGHRHAAEEVGARVTRAWVTSDSGMVELNRDDVKRMSSREYMAFMLSGRAAVGSAIGCSADEANVREEKARMRKAGVAPAEIRRTVRQAEQDARRYGRSPRVDHWADRLGERGRL